MNVRGTNALSGSDNPSLIISLCVSLYSCTFEDMETVFFQQSIQRSALLFGNDY